MFRVDWDNFRFVFYRLFFIKLQPQIIDSLLATKIFLVILINDKVGCKPAIPGIAEIHMSDLSFNPKELKLFITFVFLFLKVFLFC